MADERTYNETILPTETTYETGEGGETITVETTVTIRVYDDNGEIQRITDTKRTSGYEQVTFTNEILPRYTSANLLLGQVYRFKFLGDFAPLGFVSGTTDFSKGIYRVDQILSYREVIAQGIDLYKNLYDGLKISRAVFTRDEALFAGADPDADPNVPPTSESNTTVQCMFYKLVDPKDTSVVYYMPEIFIKDHPDTNVSKYSKVVLSVPLGTFANAGALNTLNTEIAALLEKRYGIKTTAKVLIYNDVYLTTLDYENILAAREETKASSPIDLYSILFTNDQGNQARTIAALRAKLAATEELLRQSQP